MGTHSRRSRFALTVPLLLAGALLAASSLGCGNGSRLLVEPGTPNNPNNPNSPNNPGGPQGGGTLTATIGGTGFDGQSVMATLDNDVFAFGAATTAGGTTRTLQLSVVGPSVGTFNVAQVTVQAVHAVAQGAVPLNTFVGTSGEIVITAFDAAGGTARGTFAFTGFDPVSMTQVVVTSGTFDVTF